MRTSGPRAYLLFLLWLGNPAEVRCTQNVSVVFPDAKLRIEIYDVNGHPFRGKARVVVANKMAGYSATRTTDNGVVIIEDAPPGGALTVSVESGRGCGKTQISDISFGYLLTQVLKITVNECVPRFPQAGHGCLYWVYLSDLVPDEEKRSCRLHLLGDDTSHNSHRFDKHGGLGVNLRSGTSATVVVECPRVKVEKAFDCRVFDYRYIAVP